MLGEKDEGQKMRIAITGATGFLGRYLVNHFTAAGHSCRCLYRPDSNRSGFAVSDSGGSVEWQLGDLTSPETFPPLLENCDAVIHAALHHLPGKYCDGTGELREFLAANLFGSLALISAAKAAGVPRFVFISSCTVQDIVLDDRPLDETHPLTPKSPYAAYKAAVEQFVHAHGKGEGYPICALRPVGVFGLAQPPEKSRWFSLARKIKHGRPVTVRGGGKEVHAADVARAVEILITANSAKIAGESYQCCDRYYSNWDIASRLKNLAGSDSEIRGETQTPKHTIITAKLEALGMNWGGAALLTKTLQSLLAAVPEAAVKSAPLED